MLFISALYVYYEVNIPLTCTLMSFFQPLLPDVVATTYHKEQMISLTSKPQSGSIMWEFTRELNKESLLY